MTPREQLKTSLAIVVSFLLVAIGVVSAGTGTITVKDASGTTQTFAIITDGSGHYISEGVICDYSAGANCAAVNASHQLSVSLDGGTGATVAATIADGASVTLGAKADAKSTATDTTAVTIMSVLKEISAMVQAPVSRAVTNVGTFLTQVNGFTSWAGGTLGSMANYGTSPGAVLVPGVNAYVTNTNANGAAVAASSAPVVPPTDYVAGKAISSLVFGTTTAMTSTTSTQLLAAVSAKVIYVMNISCVNSHASVGTFISVQDGSGGTILGTLSAASVYGGDEKHGSMPLFKTTSGNGLYVADVTTGANVICTASGFAQ